MKRNPFASTDEVVMHTNPVEEEVTAGKVKVVSLRAKLSAEGQTDVAISARRVVTVPPNTINPTPTKICHDEQIDALMSVSHKLIAHDKEKAEVEPQSSFASQPPYLNQRALSRHRNSIFFNSLTKGAIVSTASTVYKCLQQLMSMYK